MGGKAYARAARAHEIAEELDIPYGAAWRIATCLMKVRYRTEEAAWAAADRWRDSCPQRAYQCDVCGQWHLSREEKGREEE